MSNWNPFTPDFNPPPGIPRGYPGAINPTAPTMNPAYPHLPMDPVTNPSNRPPGAAYPYPPSASPNPAPGSHLPSGSPYPPSGSPYPPTGSPYPPSGSPYPPSGSPYASTGSPYPPSGSPYPPTGSPYPPTGSPYPPTGSPYPPTGSPYPPTGSPYPPTGSPYPPTGSPYPPTGSPYPPTGSPYPPTGSPYPPTGSSNAATNSPYPTGPTPYSHSGSSSYPNHQNNYPQSINNNNRTAGYPPGNYGKMAEYITGEGTVHPYPNFDPKVDAEVLRKAMKGFGTDEKAIINVLANRSNSQRVYIAVAFKQLYGKDLIDDLKSELSGNFETIILGLMMPLNDYLAKELHRAMSGIGTREDVLIEVLCTRTNHEIWGINEAYTRLYGKSLEDDIKSDTSGHFERMLVSACNGARSESPADGERAKQTAQALYEAGAGQWGTDESVFNAILVSESFQQLAYTFYEYQKLTGTTVTEAIKGEMSGDVKEGMLAIAKCVENRPFYFAEKLYKAMKVGLGTDDDTLIRVVVSRCEIDMVQIKAEYERNYGKPLVDAITGDTSGDYKRILVALVGN